MLGPDIQGHFRNVAIKLLNTGGYGQVFSSTPQLVLKRQKLQAFIEEKEEVKNGKGEEIEVNEDHVSEVE